MANIIISAGTVQTGSSYISDTDKIDVYGTAKNFSVANGASITISSGGATSRTRVNQGGLESIGYKGTAIVTVINNGGKVANFMGVTSGVVINSGGIMATYGRDSPMGGWEASSYDTIIKAGGTELLGFDLQGKWHDYSESYNARIYGIQSVGNRTNASNAIIYNGGSQVVTLEGASVNTIVSNGGVLAASSQGFANNISVGSGGTLVISSGGVLIGAGDPLYSLPGTTIISSGGNLVISSGATLRGELIVENGASATINADLNLNDFPYPIGSISFLGNGNNELTISGLASGGNINVTIQGVNGGSITDTTAIKFDGISEGDIKNSAYVDSNGSANKNYVTFTLKNDKKITLNVIGAETVGYSLKTAPDGSVIYGGSAYEVCFLAGSLIHTPDGDIPIEDISIGDQVMTFDYASHRKIVKNVSWVGNKKTRVKFDLPDDEAGYPVRIVKDAIAENVPYKDLLITAEHSLFFSGKFIPVRMLVNGATIYYDYSITEYTYYHIEIEKHSVILANGILTESYLDTGNRGSFEQNGNVALLNLKSSEKVWGQDSAYPLVTNREVVEPLYHYINQRAFIMDCPRILSNKQLTKDANLHLITENNSKIYPYSHSDGEYLFNIPDDVENVYIASKVSRLCDTIGPFVDNRHYLGVSIGDIVIMADDDYYPITNYLSEKDFLGWHALEKGNHRWTKGKAFLPLGYKGLSNRVLVLNVVSSNFYIVEGDRMLDIEYQEIA